MVVVVVVGLYIKSAHVRARAYTPPAAWLSSRVHIKKAKKNPRTLAYAAYGPQVVWKPNDFRHTVVANSWRVY